MHNFLVSRLGASFAFPISHRFQILFFTSLPTFFKSKKNPPKDDNFTVSYLVTSCGLSPDTAARLSRNLRLKNSYKPNAVLNLLKNHGFSKTQIATYVQQHPRVLLNKAQKTLLPKLKFIHSIGVPISEIPRVIARNHKLLIRSLYNWLVPHYKVLRSVLRSDEEVVRALRHGALSFQYGYLTVKNLASNVSVLRDSGVPQACISYLVMYHPTSAFRKHSEFVEGVQLAKKMGLDPLKISYVSAIHVLIHVDGARWEARLAAYAKCGWSHEISLMVFRKSPVLMSFTEERIVKSMNFLVRDMGWALEDIARSPQVLAYSLEKRIIPRCTVINVLKSKGLLKNRLSLGTFLCIREDIFVKKFVTKFLEDVPLLLDVYQGSIDHRDVL
ncbi:transcription termination factor MTERF2, chloroplastic-like [Abrus precatorius]|uniref:Transcription termination factor MTERF2, chloroplastic-like n=1 Tax=Abrus precatorius TaxID=3816 RepID=A0A8B8MHD5_ABRPR|nr:transcription termination factor MTERF2, chloroplastic-like [Abrus precatorius]